MGSKSACFQSGLYHQQLRWLWKVSFSFGSNGGLPKVLSGGVLPYRIPVASLSFPISWPVSYSGFS